ncbi:MAG: hypothetical protein RJB08_270 [Actinomycetota bacterium]
MTKARPALAAAFALTIIGGGITASGVAQASKPAPTTLAPVDRPVTTPKPAVPRTKNAALPTTTAARPRNITVPSASPRTKNAALPTPTTRPATVTTPVPSLPRTKNTTPTSNSLKS